MDTVLLLKPRDEKLIDMFEMSKFAAENVGAHVGVLNSEISIKTDKVKLFFAYLLKIFIYKYNLDSLELKDFLKTNSDNMFVRIIRCDEEFETKKKETWTERTLFGYKEHDMTVIVPKITSHEFSAYEFLYGKDDNNEAE